MACLDTTSKSLTIELTGSPTTQTQWTVHYATRSGVDFTESSNDGVTNSTTPVTMIASPGSGETISIRDITVYNADVSSVTIVIKLVNGGNSRVIYRQTLDTLESWSSLAQKGKDGAQGLTGSVSAASGLILDESSAPNTATNQGALYVPSSDNLLRYRGESNGTERRIALIDTTNLATNDLFYYGSDGLFKRIAIGTLDQVLVAKPSSNPPYQWATPIYREVLTANRTYYVRTDGNDSNTGLANTSGGAFLTLQKAIDSATSLDLSIYNITIQVANGTYNTTTGNILKSFVGAGSITIQGNSGTPANVIISTSGSSANNIFSATSLSSSKYIIQDLKIQSSATATVFGILSSSNSYIEFQNIDFGSGITQQIRVEDGGIIRCTGNYSISGGVLSHIAMVGGVVRCQSRTVTISGTPNFVNAFIDCNYVSTAIINGNTYNGSATGLRYNVAANSVLYTNSGGANYFPGNSAGTTATGGQYL